MAEVNFELLLSKIKEYGNYPAFKEKIDAFNALGGFSFGKIGQYILAVIGIIAEGIVVLEKIGNDLEANGIGEEKKKALVSFLDEVIDLPVYLEPFDGMVIGMMIDMLVGLLNTNITSATD